jgi:hypothetical protein
MAGIPFVITDQPVTQGGDDANREQDHGDSRLFHEPAVMPSVTGKLSVSRSETGN